MPEPATLLLVAATFLLAGAVKGITGLGLPTVSLALITVAIDMPTAMALLIVPSLATNLWQALVGGHGREVLRLIWPFLLAATATVWLGALALSRLDLRWLSALLGGLLLAYALLNLAGWRPGIRAQRRTGLGLLLGGVNGILTGMTGSFVVPGVLYLQAIGLPRDQLVQAMGMLFSASTLALALALQGNQMLSWELGLLSTAALLPAIGGMVLGQRVRRRLSEPLFRRYLFIALGLLGSYMLANAL